MAHDATSTLDRINERRLDGKLCDFEIRVEDQAFPVHRLILDTKSEYFRGMFESGMLETNQKYCTQPDITAHTAKVCLDFMYTGKLELDKPTVKDVLKVAHMWQLDSVIERCEQFLKENLDLSSSIEYKNLATLYYLKDLGEKCNDFILRNIEKLKDMRDVIVNLDLMEIIDLMRFNGEWTPGYHSFLWKFCENWTEEKSRQMSDTQLTCNIFLEFPVEKFILFQFWVYIWKNDHTKSCEKCRDHATNKFLSALNAVELNLDPQDCLILKKLSKRYGYEHLEKIADEYIVANHHDVFTREEFLETEKNDLLKYIRGINDECSIEEYSVIVNWLQCDENRHGTFADIFEYIENQPEEQLYHAFLTSLGNLPRLGVKKGWEMTYWVKDKKEMWSWWPKDCFFMKSLAQKYKCKKIEARLDKCIIRDFPETSELDGFKDLIHTEVMKYLSIPEIYRSGEEAVWNALKLWIEHDAENRAKDFPELFQAMHLDQFSTKFLREIVINSPFIEESKSCMKYLTTILLQRVDGLEKTARDHASTLNDYGKILLELNKKLEEQEKRLHDLQKSIKGPRR